MGSSRDLMEHQDIIRIKKAYKDNEITTSDYIEQLEHFQYLGWDLEEELQPLTVGIK